MALMDFQDLYDEEEARRRREAEQAAQDRSGSQPGGSDGPTNTTMPPEPGPTVTVDAPNNPPAPNYSPPSPSWPDPNAGPPSHPPAGYGNDVRSYPMPPQQPNDAIPAPNEGGNDYGTKTSSNPTGIYAPAQHTDENAPGYSIYSDPDWRKVEAQLREFAGGLFDPTDLEGVKRAYYNSEINREATGMSKPGDLNSAIGNQFGIYNMRGTNTPGEASSASWVDPTKGGTATVRNTSSGGKTTTTNTGTSNSGGTRYGLYSPGMNFDPYANGPMFDDPGTSSLESFLRERLKELTQPVQDPARDAYLQALLDRVNSLSQSNPQLDQLLQLAQQRFTDLQKPIGDSEQNTLNTQLFDPISAQKDQAKKNILQQLAARGIDPNSGIAQAALVELEKSFASTMGQARGQAASAAINRQDARMGQALDVGTFLEQVPNTRADQALNVNAILADLSNATKGETDQRRREALALVSLLSELPITRAQQAQGLISGTPSGNSIFNQLLSLQGMNTQQQLLNQQRTASLYSGLGTLASILKG